MYGTIFPLNVRRGQERRVADLFQECQRERKPNEKGAVGGLLLKPDAKAGQLIGVAVFEDKASYLANGDDSEQHQWYLRLRELLKADP